MMCWHTRAFPSASSRLAERETTRPVGNFLNTNLMTHPVFPCIKTFLSQMTSHHQKITKPLALLYHPNLARMSSNKTPQPEIFLALAIRISHTQLVARLFAYADTKGRITALRASLRQFQLPEEVISLVAEEIREQCFADTFAYYFTLSKCAANSCSVLEHFPKGYVVYEFGVRRTEDRYLEESGEIHENRLRTFYSTFKRKDGKGKINRASKVRIKFCCWASSMS